MKIKNIESRFFEAPLKTPIYDAKSTIRARSCVLVRVETDEGIVGWGEAASFAGAGKLVQTVIEHFSSNLVGLEPLLITNIFDTNYQMTQHFGRKGLVISALSGINVALWDIMGKIAGLPLYQLLGGSTRQIECYANAGYYASEDEYLFLENSINDCINKGYKAVKIKIGKHGLNDDRKRIDKARELLGANRLLMVDANGVLSPAYVRRLDSILQEYEVHWIEEPVSIRPVENLSDLAKSIVTPIAGYEIESTSYGFTPLIVSNAVSIVQPDAIWSGGITECMRIASVAHAYYCRFVPHNFASIVSLAANASLAAAASTGGQLEVDSNENPFLWPMDELNDWPLKEGIIEMPELPGLGLDINWDKLEKYRKG
jgi:L-alanine-DL-glutamate epimerase-like enolase superfamily enzyme